MDDSIRVMVERGKKKRTVACAFDWPGWDRSGKTEEDALRVLAAYRPRYAKVAALAGLADEFRATCDLTVVERLEGIGMTDYYGVSGRAAAPEQEPMSESECERKIALLRAAWTTFDDVVARVSPELRKGPRGGGRERDEIVHHVNGSEIEEKAKKVGVRTSPDAWRDADELRATTRRSVRGSASSTPAAHRRGRGGRSNSSSVAAPGTCSITPGRWRTGICPEASRWRQPSANAA
jgi:hypothetical protein